MQLATGVLRSDPGGGVRGTAQTEFQMGPAGGEVEEAPQESLPDDLDQTLDFDPAEPDPIPEEDFDQSRGA